MERTPSSVPSIAPGDRARIGHVIGHILSGIDAGQHEIRLPGSITLLTAMITQSVGVPRSA
jgi:hypothetical protein